VKTIILTGCALIAFAANSVLCRLALGEHLIDASGFTIIRLLSGATVLFLIIKVSNKQTTTTVKGSWSGTLMLFTYATAFSFAYITLDTATGALILFGAVQITMILSSLFSGTRLHISEWGGISLAFIGFSYLVLPNVTTPSITGFLLMIAAGIAWGIYTLQGRTSEKSLMSTASNFYRCTPLLLVLFLATIQDIHLSTAGILLAVVSGGIASGIGYTIWYMALGGLSATQAAVVQLLVPVIAATGGVIFVSEPITIRLTLSGTMILGGILMVVLGRYYFVQLKEIAKRDQATSVHVSTTEK